MTLKNHWITHFRERVGMSQYDLASMLCTSRSNIAMSERNERMLPAAPMLQLLQLMQLMDDPQVQAATPPLSIPPEKTEKIKAHLLYHAKTKQYEADSLLRKIKAQELYELQRAQTRLLIEAMARNQQQYKPKDRQVRWLELMRSSRILFYECILEEATTYKINLLRYSMLLQEAAAAERMAGEL